MGNYFSHDSNARSDSKIIALRMKHQWAGYGLYWALIEKLRDTTCYKLETDFSSLAYDLRADASILKSVICDFGLFAFIQEGDYFYSDSLLRRMETKDAKSEKARESVNKRWEKIRSQNDCNTNVSDSDTNVILLKEKKRKEKKDIILSNDNTSDNSNELPVPTPAPDVGTRIPFQRITEMWNITCAGYQQVVKLGDKRKNKIRIRIDEMGGLDKAIPMLQNLFDKMQASKFLRGESPRGWKANFDWLFTNDNNWVKVLEGRYDDKNKNEANNGTIKTDVGLDTDDAKTKRDKEFAEHIIAKLGGRD